MSELYKSTFRGYLIDHHSPDPPTVTLENLDPKEYDRFFKEANINHLMLYFKDHWGNSYYDTKVGKKHSGLDSSWIDRIIPVIKENKIEVNAYYCFEYDTYAPKAHPEWAVKKKDGSPLRCGENSYASIAKWGIPCLETGYRQYAMEQLKEMISIYHPDSLFIDIFGKSVCYCPVCREKFKKRFGYELPEDHDDLMKKNQDVLEFVNDSADDMLKELINTLKTIDPKLAITINFGAHYPKKTRDKLDYLFTEPWAGNWLSGAYARALSGGKYPQLGPGDVSQVYNYQPDNIYLLAASEIAAQGCRIFFYSESMHPDGTLDHEEARKIGKAYNEVKKYEQYLTDREVIADIGIVQSDWNDAVKITEPIIHNSIGRAKVGGLHRDALLGAMKLCDYSKFTWNIIPEEELEIDKMMGYKMLILPNLYNIGNDLKENIRKYVEAGGVIFTAGETGLYSKTGELLKEFVLKDLYNCSFECIDKKYSSNVWSSYIVPEKDRVWDKCADTTPPVSEFKVNIRNNGSKILGYFKEPAVVLSDNEWVNWGYPPPSKDTSYPALIENSYGRGKVIYAAFDFFTMENKGFKWLKGLFNGILEKYITPGIYLDTKYPEILGFTSFKRTDSKEIIIHEISHMAKIANGDTPFITGGELVIRKDLVKLKEAFAVYPNKKQLSFEEDGDMYKIKLDDIDIHQIIVLKY